MGGIPRAALILGLAGLIPFLYGAAASRGLLQIVGFPGLAVLEVYGVVILAFMAGTLWGFAAKGPAPSLLWLGLSTVPAIALFFAIIVGDSELIFLLVFGFPALLVFDYAFQRSGSAPRWWMKLRILLTIVATTCLIIGALP